MNKKITGVLLDAENGTIGIATLDDDLHAFYAALHCDLIDITSRRIGDEYYNIICDDEGFFKEFPKLTAVDRNNGPMFVGSLFVVGPVDAEGNLESLSEGECQTILAHAINAVTHHPDDHNSIITWPVLTGVEY